VGRRKVGKLQRLLRDAKKDEPIHKFVSAHLPDTPRRGDKERAIEAAADHFRKDRRDIQRALERWETGAEARAALAEHSKALEPMFRSISSSLAEFSRAMGSLRAMDSLEEGYRAMGRSFEFVRQWISEEEIQDISTGGSMPLLQRIARDRKELAELRSILKGGPAYHKTAPSVSGRKSGKSGRQIHRRITHR
jgi:hypothetical protein